MSRIGKHPVPIVSGVKVAIDGQQISAEGKNGKLSMAVVPQIEVVMEGNTVRVAPRDESQRARVMWATTRTLVSNLINGVATGFVRRLEINGVGYKAQVQGQTLVLQLGYSHDIRYAIPTGIKIECPDQTHVNVHGADKQQVGQVAAEIRSYRPVEPYKGKGIKYDDEYVIRKEGKKK